MRLNARFMSKHSKMLKNRLNLRPFFRVFTFFMYNLSIYSLICDSRAFKSRFFWFWCLILLKYAFLNLMITSFKFWILYKIKKHLFRSADCFRLLNALIQILHFDAMNFWLVIILIISFLKLIFQTLLLNIGSNLTIRLLSYVISL